MAKGYAVKIEDGKGNEKKYFSNKAKSHEQGNSLASALIEHLSVSFPDYKPFSTRTVQPSDGGVGYEDISKTPVDEVAWP